MKKIMLFTVALATFAACTKTEIQNNADTPSRTSFKAGQAVTLNVSVPTSSQTKVNGTLNSSGGIDFKWELGDKILVSVGDKSAEFTLASGSGQAKASFTGTMPASGDTFDVQFPVSDPVLTAQTYVKGALPHNMMKATASNCTISAPFELTPVNSALRLKLYGANQTVGKIIVTNVSSTASPQPSYTLSCGSGVEIGTGSDSATPFLIVMPISATVSDSLS